MMRSRTGPALVLLLTALTLGFAAPLAAEVQVSMDLSQETVSLGSQIDYTIRFVSRSEAPSFRFVKIIKSPEFTGLRLNSETPMQSSRSHYVNGRMTATLELRWTLTVTDEKECRVGPAVVRYKDDSHTLPGRELKVVEEVGAHLSRNLRQLGILPPRSKHPELDEQLQGRLFARLEVSDVQPYLLETIRVDCKIYADPRIGPQVGGLGWQAPSWPSAFFAEEIANRSRGWREEELNGRKYRTIIVGRYYLTPNKAGRYELPLSVGICEIHVETQSQRRSFEDMFFGRDIFNRVRRIPVSLPMAPREIEVQPLPAEGVPASFQNAVGRVEFSAKVDRETMSEDDLLTLRLTVGGQLFLGGLERPRLPELEGWTVVDEQMQTQPRGESKSYLGHRQFEILLRPERSGTLTLPQIEYAFFNPDQRRYEVARGGPFTVQVRPGESRELLVSESSEPRMRGPEGARPQVFADQPAHIQLALPALGGTALPFYRRSYFLALQLAPLLLLLVAAGWRGVAGHRARNEDRIRRRGAGGRARRELRKARKALAAGQAREFQALLAEALRAYLALKWDRAAAGLTLEEIESRCRAAGVEADTTRDLVGLLDRCEQGRYLPEAPDAEAMREDLDRAARLLGALDRALK